MRVLLIEDDGPTARSIELMLKSENCSVRVTGLGEEGVELGKRYDYDMILLDLGLPDISGYEALRALRLAEVASPVLILSGLAGAEDKVKGLCLGADDYLTKPFHRDEVVARIRAILRRSAGRAQAKVTIGDVVVKLDEQTAEVGGARLQLTGREYRVLEILALRKETTPGKEMYLNHLSGGMNEAQLKVIDSLIVNDLQKLARAVQQFRFRLTKAQEHLERARRCSEIESLRH